MAGNSSHALFAFTSTSLAGLRSNAGSRLSRGCSRSPILGALRCGGEAPADTTIFGDGGRLTQPARTTICGGVHMVVLGLTSGRRTDWAGPAGRAT